jgi:hypothetical protein
VGSLREFGVARFQFRHELAHALGIFDFEGDEAVPALAIRVADQRVEGSVVARVFRVAATGGMFEEELVMLEKRPRETRRPSRRAIPCKTQQIPCSA